MCGRGVANTSATSWPCPADRQGLVRPPPVVLVTVDGALVKFTPRNADDLDCLCLVTSDFLC
jgi:hypothetical protein